MPRSVPAVACAELSAPICLFLLQISMLHRFQRLVVTLKPSGRPTLISPNGTGSPLSHAHTIHMHSHGADRGVSRHWKAHCLHLSRIIHKEGPRLLFIQWYLCASKPLFWYPIPKVVIIGILGFSFQFCNLVTFNGNWNFSHGSCQLNSEAL